MYYFDGFKDQFGGCKYKLWNFFTKKISINKKSEIPLQINMHPHSSFPLSNSFLPISPQP